jgi:serine/threonine-protein kinase
MLLNNRYQVLRTLGSGGFGETFVAEDTQMPSGRWCVVKKLRPVSNDPRIYQLVKERFQREAAILEDLGNQSDRIPKLYAYFEENSDFYLVQELIEGETLAITQQKKEFFTESYVRNFLVNFLLILDYIHNKKIIHRDIKPDNIIIRQYDNEPVLIDFGAVKECMGTQLTSSGSKTSSIVIGTPGFMPSEQAAGRPVYGSDLYATGLTAVCLLTGKPPQDIETDYHTGELIWKQYAPRVSPTLASILDKAIQSHVRERYSTAKEMLQALQGTTATYTNKALQPVVAESSLNDPVTRSSHSTSKLENLQNTLLMGSFISAAIITGFWITKQPQIVDPSTNISDNPISDATNSPKSFSSSEPLESFNPSSLSDMENLPPSQSTPSPPSEAISTPAPESVLPTSPPQTSSLGWIRLGSVNNITGTALTGEMLIATTQPVTISPVAVPKVGDQVVTITGVNLRRDLPQPPNYQLEEKVSVLQPNQRLKVLNIKTFVDSNSPSPYTVVWAEVGLP